MFEIINDEKLYFEKFKDFSIDQEKFLYLLIQNGKIY